MARGMTGKKHSEESKAKMRKNQSPNSKKSYFKKGHAFIVGGESGWFKKGSKPSNWKGGTADERHRLRKSSQYRKFRDSIFKRANYLCEECGNGGDMHIHHIKHWAKYPDLRFDVYNGKLLCIECHAKYHPQIAGFLRSYKRANLNTR